MANCPRCGVPVGPAGPARPDPTFRPTGPELVLHRWVCPSCGTPSVLATGPDATVAAELTGALLRQATGVEPGLADELAPDRHVAGELRPGWACAAARVLDGEPAWPPTRAGRAAVDSALHRLREVGWEPTLGTEQSEPVRRHFDAVATWVRAAGMPHLWPGCQPTTLVRDDPGLVSAALDRLAGEEWYADLPSSAPARRDLVHWLVWLELDAAGEVPVTLPDPYEPLVRAYETGGVVLASRELRNELFLGTTTLRLPDSVDDWPAAEVPQRSTLYERDC